MKRYMRIVIYSIVGAMVLMLYLMLVTLSDSMEQVIHRKGRFINREVEETMLEETDSEMSEEAKLEILKKVESENNERLQTIETICKKYKIGLYRQSMTNVIPHPPVPQYGVFYFDRGNKWSFCPIYKAGSSTWLYNLCLLSGMTEEYIKSSNKQLSVLARSKYPELQPDVAEEILHDSIKVLTVRHPFERLLSAYRDKLENTNHGQEHGTIHFYQAFGSKIVKKYRKEGNKTKSWELLKPSQYLWNSELPKPAGIEPTFQEFVRYLNNLDLASYADDHWIPYYLYCTPCLLHYDIVAKVETMDDDQLYAIHVLGVQEKIKPRWQHKTRFAQENKVGENSPSYLAKIYFQQLSTEEINQLYEKYKIDFELFGYDHTEYLEYAHDYKKDS